MDKMKRKVKIVCTIGPACWEYDTLFKVAEAGMNVARLNFSHGDYASHERTLNNVRAVERCCSTPRDRRYARESFPATARSH